MSLGAARAWAAAPRADGCRAHVQGEAGAEAEAEARAGAEEAVGREGCSRAPAWLGVLARRRAWARRGGGWRWVEVDGAAQAMVVAERRVAGQRGCWSAGGRASDAASAVRAGIHTGNTRCAAPRPACAARPRQRGTAPPRDATPRRAQPPCCAPAPARA